MARGNGLISFSRPLVLGPAEAFIRTLGVATLKVTQRQEVGGSSSEEAILGGGCFWCFDAIFSKLRGVEKVESGYSGGTVPNPTYEQVCSDETGHAEIVKITFDPKVISYRQLLEIFFTVHDPTTLNRQGADVGSQYRSVIFYRDEGQKATAEEVVREVEAEGIWGAPIVTELTAVGRLLQGGGLPSRLLREEPKSGLLQGRDSPEGSQVPEEVCEPARVASARVVLTTWTAAASSSAVSHLSGQTFSLNQDQGIPQKQRPRP